LYEMKTPEQAFASLNSRNFYELAAAIEAVGQFNYAPAVPKLREMLDSPTVDVGLIVKVAKALSAIGTPLAMEILKTYLFAETTQLSRHAYEQTTFEKISRSAIVSAAAKRALKELNTPQSQAILEEWEVARKRG
jgi:HEAT repeat protein